jgi:hypothetical protein
MNKQGKLRLYQLLEQRSETVRGYEDWVSAEDDVEDDAMTWGRNSWFE